jgi:RNA polymerase-binding transcription factor DksA
VTDAGTEPSIAEDVDRLAAIGQELSAVEATLRRIDDGRYGLCEVCSAPIDAARLAAGPTEARCASHSVTAG